MDKVLFIVEGEKTEKQFVKLIYEQLYGENSNATSDHSQVEFKWIKNADINAFVKTLETDEFGFGVSAENYFASEEGTTYSETYILIDADLKDKSGSGENDVEKIKLINKLYNYVQDMDNTELILSSPQIESIVDVDDVFKYVEGIRYKHKISGRFASGACGELTSNMQAMLLMNIDKFLEDNIEYDQQSMHPINTYDYNSKEIKVRNVLFHIIANKEFIYDGDLLKTRIIELLGH